MPREPGSLWKSHRTMCVDRGWPDEGCEGQMRVEADEPPRPMVARCDGCAFVVGVLQPGTPERTYRHPAEPPEERGGEPVRRRRAPRAEHSDDPFLGAT